MSSQREVLMIILALLQRKTLIETKNSKLKFLKRHYSTVLVVVLTEDNAFALLFRPHSGGFDSSKVPTPGKLPSKAKNMLMPGGQPGGGGGVKLGAAGIDWCISHLFFSDQPFYGNYSALASHTNTLISHTLAYSSRWRRKPWQGLLPSAYHENSWTSMVSYKDYIQ